MQKQFVNIKQAKELIVVNVPEDVYDFNIQVYDNLQFVVFKEPNKVYHSEVRLSKFYNGKQSNYKILGKLSELSEEECKTLVMNQYGDLFDYTGKNMYCSTAKESLISLLQANKVNTNNPNTLLLIKKI